MSGVGKKHVLRLYRHLLRYGNQVELTDKEYFLGRIKSEFKKNKDLTDPDHIEFALKEQSNMIKFMRFMRFFSQKSGKVDYSNYPKLIENELEEKFIRGSGPGGQSVNKTASAVLLRHIPTDTIVKCHVHRSLHENRKEARKILLNKIDNLLNGEKSIEAQLKVIESKKHTEKLRRQKIAKELKDKWKEREKLDRE